MERKKSSVFRMAVRRRGLRAIRRAIGGLTSTDETVTRRGVPILKDIPLLKYLFSYNQTQIQQNEKQSVMQMLERESKRERNLDARAKEMRAKERRAAESQNAEGDKGKTPWEDQARAVMTPR